ncbi:TIGR03621 family F420-dependent LLM class oxidoreductase [Mycobacterium sp. MYCO198283]|uniref:TIGR03621 family F420-dependent LLM class oxidoreductase n=1 Tax=Mycobacterium sp. MYCO198283 TaxID=2883505 RepID=UPI001E43B6E9|nr:TIGR03621 family F420-dependent LLM class oxidoreductase [Mycobacterium sp. MYCO198283]MCG5431056.1 TIGR03621 family F420-dependent LLM class oxidoreductase [Mycobacterium sp. MYCO198283]
MTSAFRFGVGLHDARSLEDVRNFARRAESMGYDVLHAADHLGSLAPFPVLTAVAAVTDTLRVGTFVLNAAFYRPALLARDVAALSRLSGGRSEVGLGTGYVREEFEAAELRYPSACERVDHLRHTTTYLRANVPDVPVLIAGNGDRVLRLAARHAHMVGLTGGDPVVDGHDPLAERISFVRDAAENRFGELELNLAVTALPTDGSGRPDLSITRHFVDLPDDQLLALPSVLSGTTRDMADTLLHYRDRYGITYITVQQPVADAFADVIALLR